MQQQDQHSFTGLLQQQFNNQVCESLVSILKEHAGEQENGAFNFCQNSGQSMLSSPISIFAQTADIAKGLENETKLILNKAAPVRKVALQSYSFVCYVTVYLPFNLPSRIPVSLAPVLDYFSKSQTQEFKLKSAISNRSSVVVRTVQKSSEINIQKQPPKIQNQQEENNDVKNQAKSGELYSKLQELKENLRNRQNHNETSQKVQFQFQHVKNAERRQKNKQPKQKQAEPSQNFTTDYVFQKRRRISQLLQKANKDQRNKRGQQYKLGNVNKVIKYGSRYNADNQGELSGEDDSGGGVLDLANILQGIQIDDIELKTDHEMGSLDQENDSKQGGELGEYTQDDKSNEQMWKQQLTELQDDSKEEQRTEKQIGVQRSQVSKSKCNQKDDMDKEVQDLIGILDTEYHSLTVTKSLPTMNGKQIQKTTTTSDWAVPVDNAATASKFDKVYHDSMPITFSFELDNFQKAAAFHLEEGNSVFVAAHTSAGKTVVAEYAFALSQRHNTRVAYTSPIKTISNQKYRDFAHKGFQVGILTGDVQVNMEAPALIMTTEILRSMLYKAADIVRDLEFVIFDEVHYVNDIDRGVVWEEVIIMLPEHVKMVLLSATVANVMEFADWVGRIKRKHVHVVTTSHRPVPLHHYLYFNKQTYLVYQEGQFRKEGLHAAQEDAYGKKQKEDGSKSKSHGAVNVYSQNRNQGLLNAQYEINRTMNVQTNRTGSQQKEHVVKLVNMLRLKELVPAIIFVFSKKKIDEIADWLSRADLLSGVSEKSQVHKFCEKSLARLKESDRRLPQIMKVKDLLKRGIGIHHAGLLPIIKEIVEMLFCRGLVRLLISTETFAMGVNAPARTVVFHGIKKHDGRELRLLLPGEYTQMSGRAGRRGLDLSGSVIIDTVPSSTGDERVIPAEKPLRTLLDGKCSKLSSRFRVSFGMILKLLRVEDLKVEDMLRHSFAEFHSQRRRPQQLLRIKKAEAVLKKLKDRPWPNDLPVTVEDVRGYIRVSQQLQALNERIQEQVMITRAGLNTLVVGRVAMVKIPDSYDIQPAVLLGSPAHLLYMNMSVESEESEEEGDLMTVSRRKNKKGLGIGDANPLQTLSLLDGNPSQVLYAAIVNKQASLQSKPTPQPEQQAQSSVQQLVEQDTGLVLIKGKQSFKGQTKDTGPLPRYGIAAGVDYMLFEVAIKDIVAVTQVKLQVRADAALDGQERSLGLALSSLVRTLDEAESKQQELPLVDPVNDLKIASVDMILDVRRRNQLITERSSMHVHQFQKQREEFNLVFSRVKNESLLEDRIQKLRTSLADEGLSQMPEFEKKTVVLQKLGYLDESMVVQLKGRVACEINSADEVLATEMIFQGVFQNLSPEEAVAVISPLVFQERSSHTPALQTNNLVLAVDQTLSIAEDVALIQMINGLDVTSEDYINETLHFGLLDAVYEWAKGTPFDQICKLTDVMEGSIVRTVVRLEQACREMMDAARVMGDTQLYLLMQDCARCIRRDVIFAASLYIAQ